MAAYVEIIFDNSDGEWKRKPYILKIRITYLVLPLMTHFVFVVH